MLTDIQKKRFKEISGFDYQSEHGLKGSFQTPYPNNDRNWEYSSWFFSYQFDSETNHLHLELDHRMTNNRINVFDTEGGSVSDDNYKFFKPHW